MGGYNFNTMLLRYQMLIAQYASNNAQNLFKLVHCMNNSDILRKIQWLNFKVNGRQKTIVCYACLYLKYYGM